MSSTFSIFPSPRESALEIVETPLAEASGSKQTLYQRALYAGATPETGVYCDEAGVTVSATAVAGDFLRHPVDAVGRRLAAVKGLWGCCFPGLRRISPGTGPGSSNDARRNELGDEPQLQCR